MNGSRMEIVACDLCGVDNSSPYLETTDRFTGKPFTLSICNDCHLIYLRQRPDLSELDDLYPDDYEAYHLLGQLDSRLENWHYKRSILKQLNYVNRIHAIRGRILDLGCATGNFLVLAREEGWHISGLEVVKKVAELAHKQLDINIINTDIESADLPVNSFDVITLWDVLEHLGSPKNVLLRMKELLRPDGHIFISIPNLNSFDQKLFGSEWIGWDAPRHFTLYDSETIGRLLSDTGFKIVDRRCLLGGKGTFFLSLDRVIQKRTALRSLRRIYPLISGLLWPYRQFSYVLKRGPIMYYAICKVNE